ncbi:MAG: hypothetical protein WD794_02490 [Mycobacteriales bacterium]
MNGLDEPGRRRRSRRLQAVTLGDQPPQHAAAAESEPAEPCSPHGSSAAQKCVLDEALTELLQDSGQELAAQAAHPSLTHRCFQALVDAPAERVLLVSFAPLVPLLLALLATEHPRAAALLLGAGGAMLVRACARYMRRTGGLRLILAGLLARSDPCSIVAGETLRLRAAARRAAALVPALRPTISELLRDLKAAEDVVGEARMEQLVLDRLVRRLRRLTPALDHASAAALLTLGGRQDLEPLLTDALSRLTDEQLNWLTPARARDTLDVKLNGAEHMVGKIAELGHHPSVSQHLDQHAYIVLVLGQARRGRRATALIPHSVLHELAQAYRAALTSRNTHLGNARQTLRETEQHLRQAHTS